MPGALSAGVEYEDINLLIVSSEELFSNPKRKNINLKALKMERKLFYQI